MKEHDIQTRILEALGAKVVFGGTSLYVTPVSFFWRTNAGTRGRLRCNFTGCPDIVGCVRGRFVGIEVKKPGGKQREEQARFERLSTDTGAVYILTDNLADAVTPVVAMMREAA